VTEHQEKTWFFHAFPKSYQEKFSESMFTIKEKTMEQIATYFQRLHAKEMKTVKFVSGDGQKRKRDDDDQSHHTSNKRQRGRDRCQGRRNVNGGGRSNSNGNGTILRFSDQCPNHPHLSHSWGECFGNPNLPNYRPPRFGNNGKSHRDGNSRGRDNKRSSGGKDSRNAKRLGGCQDQSDVHHYDTDASRSGNNKSASRRSGSRQRSSSFSEESEHDNHYIKQTPEKRVMSSLFDDE
jgi:hypothetical protein